VLLTVCHNAIWSRFGFLAQANADGDALGGQAQGLLLGGEQRQAAVDHRAQFAQLPIKWCYAYLPVM
jgi:hypothetical protein